MTFPTVVFGSASVTTPNTATFTDGNSIPSGGFILHIKPMINVGGSGIDIGFTYINQFGVTKTTAVSTAIAAGTTAGSHIKVVLEPGDTGIRDLISISYFAGGTAGDALSFESLNEGLGAPPFDIILTDSHDRNIAGSYWNEQLFSRSLDANFFDIFVTIPELYNSNPIMQIPLEFVSSSLYAFLPDMTILRFYAKEEEVSKLDKVSWLEEISGRDLTGYEYIVLKSWLESIVGQVISGYITNTSGQLIYNAIKLILISTTASTQQPTGISDALPVDPVTGLYQAFVKNVIYNDRYLIIQAGVGKYTSLKGGGTPSTINGSQTLPIPYNLQFECPSVVCDFDLTRKQ